jgi:hypothetical protein
MNNSKSHTTHAMPFKRTQKHDLLEAEEHFTNHLRVVKMILKVPLLPAKLVAELADSIIEFALGMSLLHHAQDIANYEKKDSESE